MPNHTGTYTANSSSVRLMRLVAAQPQNVQEAVKATIESNAYFAHPENILVAMMCDADRAVRAQGVSRLLAARRQPLATAGGVRTSECQS